MTGTRCPSSSAEGDTRGGGREEGRGWDDHRIVVTCLEKYEIFSFGREKYGHPFPPPVGVWRGLASQPRVEQVSLGSPTR